MNQTLLNRSSLKLKLNLYFLEFVKGIKEKESHL